MIPPRRVYQSVQYELAQTPAGWWVSRSGERIATLQSSKLSARIIALKEADARLEVATILEVSR